MHFVGRKVTSKNTETREFLLPVTVLCRFRFFMKDSISGNDFLNLGNML